MWGGERIFQSENNVYAFLLNEVKHYNILEEGHILQFSENNNHELLRRGEKSSLFYEALLHRHEINVISSRKLQSLTSCTLPAADLGLEERISLTV